MLSEMTSRTSLTSDSNSRYMLSHASSMSSVTSPVQDTISTAGRLSSVASNSTMGSDSLSSSNSISIASATNEEPRGAPLRKRLSVEDLTKGMLGARSISMASDISSHSRSGGDFPSESSSACSTPRGETASPLSHQMSSVSTAGNEPPLMNVNVISSPFLNSTDSRTMSVDTNNAVSALSSDAINSAFGARLRNIERSVNAQMDWLKLKQMKQDESIREVKNLITDLTSMIKRDRADIAYRRMSRKDGPG